VLEERLVGGALEEVLESAGGRRVAGALADDRSRGHLRGLRLRAEVRVDQGADQRPAVRQPAGLGRRRQVQAAGEPPRLGRGALGDPELDAVRPEIGKGEAGAVGGPPQAGDAGPLGQAGDPALREIGEAQQPQPGHVAAAARGMVLRPEAEPAQPQLRLRQLRDGRQGGAVEDQQPFPLGIELDRGRQRRVDDVDQDLRRRPVGVVGWSGGRRGRHRGGGDRQAGHRESHRQDGGERQGLPDP